MTTNKKSLSIINFNKSPIIKSYKNKFNVIHSITIIKIKLQNISRIHKIIHIISRSKTNL